jgi:hypothetical protein
MDNGGVKFEFAVGDEVFIKKAGIKSRRTSAVVVKCLLDCGITESVIVHNHRAEVRYVKTPSGYWRLSETGPRGLILFEILKLRDFKE